MKTNSFKKRLKLSLLSLVGLMMSFNLMAQPSQITGTVTDKGGSPLVGVTVVEKGTTNGTVTDIDGNYTISTSEDATLVYSFVGMISQQIDVSGKTSINITLADDVVGLEEVVAVGYGTQKKADLTGAVSTVAGDQLIKGVTPQLAESLAGKITGVTSMSRSGAPGAEDVDFFIRGKSTFSDNNNAPLVLVDGIERGMNRINPNDIESVTVLKDAASAAIYGVKGANGVILITTKRAKEGQAEIIYDGKFGIQTPSFLPDQMNSYEYATHLNEAIFNTAQLSGSEYVPKYNEAELEAFKNGTAPNTDWWAETMNENAPIQTHSITISNGSKNVRYRASMEYLTQDGLYDISGYERYNMRANIDGDITKNLSMSVNIAARFDERNEQPTGNSWQQLSSAYPTFAPYIEINGQQEYGWNGLNESPIGRFKSSGYLRNTGSVFQSSVTFNYNVPFINGLSAKYTYAFDRENYQRKNFHLPYTFYTGTDPVADKKQSIPEIELTQRFTERSRRTGHFILNYDKEFGDHEIGGMFVFEHSDYYNEWIEAYRDGFISDALDQMFAGSTSRIGNDGSANENARLGYVGRINYNYKDKYLLQVNARYDKSFNFPIDKAGGWFPAFSAAWRMSEESFLDEADWLSNLKLRATAGVYGNDRITPYQYLSLFGFSSTRSNPSGTVTGSGYQQGITPGVIPNPDVTWEKAKNYNFGLDFALFDGALSGEFEVFKKRTEGLLIAREDIPVEVGARLAPFNLGIVDNQGFESAIRYKNTFNEFKMSVEGTVTYATSEIIEMSEPDNVPEGLKQTGRPFDSRYGYKCLGFFKDAADIADSPDQSYFGEYQAGDLKYEDVSGDGKIDGEDRTFIGRGGMPELVFGLNTYFEYKGIELTANFQGGALYTHRFQPSPFVNNGNGMQAYTDAWTVENPDTWLPRNYQGNSSNNNAYSDYWLTDGKFLKLRSAEIAYNLPRLETLKKVGIEALRLSVSGSNLFSLSNIDFWDPEASDMGTHYWYYLQMRTINFGVQVTF